MCSVAGETRRNAESAADTCGYRVERDAHEGAQPSAKGKNITARESTPPQILPKLKELPSLVHLEAVRSAR